MSMPVNRIFPPILCILLGLGNYTCSKFKESFCSRIKNQSQEETDAQNMSLMKELKCNDSLVKLNDLKDEFQNKNQERIALIVRIKDRGMSR